VVANFLKHGPNIWIGDLVTDSKYEDTYKSWVKRRESISYVFKCDLEQLDNIDEDLKSINGDYPRLLQLYMRDKVCIETVIILSNMVGFLKKWKKDISDPIVWPEIYNTCMKYAPFIEYDAEKLKRITVETIC
jgi:hypothetical protein